MFIRSQDATTRKGDNVEIRNYVTSALSDTMSIAAVDLKGPHPKSLNTKSDRAYYILEGTANVEVGSTQAEVRAGDAVYIPKNTHIQSRATSAICSSILRRLIAPTKSTPSLPQDTAGLTLE